MTLSQCLLRIFRLLAVFLLIGSACGTAAIAGGVEDAPRRFIGGKLYEQQNDRECKGIGTAFAKDLKLMALFSNAFYDAGNQLHLCFHIFADAGAMPQDMVYQISDQDGHLLDALSPPVSSSPVPLSGCTVMDIYFEDYNQDGITDILLGIRCFKAQEQGAAVGQGDSVVYLSSVSENTIWLRQREDVNRAIASLSDYGQTEEVIRSVLSKDAVPAP